MIHTSKKKVLIETKGGRTATKVKTIVTTSELKKEAANVDNGGTRRSGRAKTQTVTAKKVETIQSPSRSLTNGTTRTTAKSQAATTSNAKFQSNLFAELSKKSSNFSPDVVSDLEEILGSPIKTARESRSEQASRTQAKSEQLNAKSSGMVRVDYKSQTDDEAKPATRSSKRLSNRVQPMPNALTKSTRNSTKSSKKSSAAFNADTDGGGGGLSSEDSQESQESQDEPDDHLQISNNLQDNIVMNIKQEKEVSYTMTDENSVVTCELCSAVFTDRAQLLIHVPVHI